MLCDVWVRRVAEKDSGEWRYELRVARKRALGSAGGSAADEQGFASIEELATAMQELGLPVAVQQDAARALQAWQQRERFLQIAEGVHIPFEKLESSGFLLFDED